MTAVPQPSLDSAAAALARAAQAWQAGAWGEVVAVLTPWADAHQPLPDALLLAAMAHLRQGQTEQALARQRQLVQLQPASAAAWINLASTQGAVGQTEEALASLDQALALDPMQPAAHFNRGNVLMQRGDAAAACDSYRRAAELAPDRADPRCNLAMALNALGRHDDALAIMRDVVERHPGLAVGWNMLGMTWHRLQADREALEAYQQAVRIDPTLVDAWSNGAQVLARLERRDEALTWARHGVQLNAEHAAALRTLGVVLAGGKTPQLEARQWLDNALGHDPRDAIALSNLVNLDTIYCDWTALDAHLAQLRTLWTEGEIEGLELWRLLSLPIPGDELRAVTEATCARRFGRAASRSVALPNRHRGQPRPARLRIGYFSSDFRQHATSVLMAGMFECHDRARFETVAYCLAQNPPDQSDAMRRRLLAAFDRLQAVGHLPEADLVRLAREQDLHIAVDLNGHTAGGRMGIFVSRVAPIQVHYLAYAGTLGMPGSIDYLVADPVVAPPDARSHFSEKLIQLPDSYQVNDRLRLVDPRVPSRAELGLPADAFVFCCFNNNYKIRRDVFAIWMSVLSERPGSVLWLLADHDETVRRLRLAASGHGIDPNRLVFAERTALPQHLARHAQADLFIDTWPYNAHTTASDALWTGLPVVTCAGQTYASRVGASLLRACGLPQLITHDPRAYRHKLLELSAAPQSLQAIRRQLLDTRLTVPLFDTERFTRHLERAYDMAWERHTQGLPPDHLTVAPLA